MGVLAIEERKSVDTEIYQIFTSVVARYKFCFYFCGSQM